MKYTPINCWRVDYKVPELQDLHEMTPTFQVFKKSILKTGYRAYILEDDDLEKTDWYKDFILQLDVRFYIDGSGVNSIANIDLSENEIYFEKRGVPIGWQPWIYYCWQSDYDKSWEEILKALKSAVRHINANHDPLREIEVIESIAPGQGAVNIRTELEENLMRSLLAVFDISNVSQSLHQDRYFPNGNVSYELGLATVRKRPSQMVLIKKRNPQIPKDKDQVLFDFRQTKRIEYERPKDLHGKILKELQDVLKYMKYLRVEP